MFDATSKIVFHNPIRVRQPRPILAIDVPASCYAGLRTPRTRGVDIEILRDPSTGFVPLLPVYSCQIVMQPFPIHQSREPFLSPNSPLDNIRHRRIGVVSWVRLASSCILLPLFLSLPPNIWY